PIETVDPLHRPAHRPPPPDGVDPEPKRAALVVRAAPEVVAHHPRHDRLQQRVTGDRRLPLHLPHVRAAGHPDVAVAPRLSTGPSDAVVPVVRLVIPGDELTFGVVSTADVLGDVGIPLLRPKETEVHQQIVVVGSAREEDRPRAVAVAGEVNVGREADAVSHRHRKIVEVADVGRAKDGHANSSYAIDWLPRTRPAAYRKPRRRRPANSGPPLITGSLEATAGRSRSSRQTISCAASPSRAPPKPSNCAMGR